MRGREIARGAEAIIYEQDGTIRKERPKKAYRNEALDKTLRKRRTKKEAKLLKDLEKIRVPAPRIIETDGNETILMEKVEGEKLRDVLDERPALARKVAKHVAKMHDHDIIHGDLTTSNIILSPNDETVLIDFGLTYHSTRIEDKAVDLHLFKQALESKHHLVARQAWESFKEGYCPAKKEQILRRLKDVERRGRNK